MPNPIPPFDHNLVIPPHLGNPTDPSQVSPYPCTTIDLCERFGTNAERRAILEKLLDFRERLLAEGLTDGFQWLDGSFLEDIEIREKRPPNDLDVLTIFWGYDQTFQRNLLDRFPEFANRSLAKANYSLDHFPLDVAYSPLATVEMTRYWISLFSHNRLGIWKGMLRIELNTPDEDAKARGHLASSAI